MASNTQNMAGANFASVFNPSADAAYPTAPFAAGTLTLGSDGTSWIYAVAAEAISAGNAVGVDPSSGSAGKLTKAMADAGRIVGAAQVAIGSGYYGWVQLAGQMSVTLKNSCLPNVPLYTTASAGMLDDTAASQTRVYGIRSTDTATASGASKVCWAQGIST